MERDPMDAIIEEDVSVTLAKPAVKTVKVAKDGWRKDVTMEEVKKAQDKGILVGFDNQPNGLYSVKVK